MFDPIINSIRKVGKAGKSGKSDKKNKKNDEPYIPPFERCPPKICKLIFDYACDDDGATGRSLSLVSRYVHAMSEESKFRSLAVCGMKQLFFCAELLREKPPHLRRIVHLFISAGVQIRSGMTEGNIVEWLYSVDTHHGAGCAAFFEILTMAGPTMKTLYVSSPCARPMIFLDIEMPELEEFTFFNELHANPAVGPLRQNYPKLKRLRFTGCGNINRTVLTEICAQAPNITHLFFQMGRTGDDLLEHLIAAFGLKGIRNDRRLPLWPKRFRDQLVEVRIEAPNKKKGFHGKMYERLIKQVTALEPRIKVITIPVAHSIPYCYSLQDWHRTSTIKWNFPIPHKFID